MSLSRLHLQHGAAFLLISLAVACSDSGSDGTEIPGGSGGKASGTGSGGKASSTGGTAATSGGSGGKASGGTAATSGGSGGASTQAHGPLAVNLGTASGFVILAKSGIGTVPTSVVTGNIGVSPIDSTGITGFSLTLAGPGTFSTSSQLIGMAYAAEYTSPTPSNLTTAVGNMETAFTDAAGRPTPDFTELAAGNISGLTMVPGLYKWGTGILISTDITLAGGPNDVWIFQIGGGITEASGVKVVLSGGALAKNVFWQTAGAVALGTSAHLEGIVLSLSEITLATGATVNGRLLSQTAVTLDASTVTQPAP